MDNMSLSDIAAVTKDKDMMVVSGFLSFCSLSAVAFGTVVEYSRMQSPKLVCATQ